MGNSNNQIKWYMLAFMCFSTLWSFGNVLNGFMYFNGTQVIFSWILMFALYFVPYALMVGELGSAFKNSGGGVSSWIHETTGAKAAYYAGWTYWACHVTYIAAKGSGGLKALSWMIFQNAEKYASFHTRAVQLATFGVLLFFCWVASRGLNPLKKFATIAGTSMFVMSILYILLMFAAPVINPGGGFLSVDFSLKNLIPVFDWKYFGSLSILVFAACNAIGQFSTLVVSIDAPLRMLLDNEDARQFIPTKLLKKNKYGAYVNGIWMVVILSGSIILAQVLVPNADTVLRQLTQLNSVTMPMRYLWVFFAYIMLRKHNEKFSREYKFVKNNGVALGFGIWCFFLTAACCLLGMYKQGDLYTTLLNVITPVVLVALGLILPAIKKREGKAS